MIEPSALRRYILEEAPFQKGKYRLTSYHIAPSLTPYWHFSLYESPFLSRRQAEKRFPGIPFGKDKSLHVVSLTEEEIEAALRAIGEGVGDFDWRPREKIPEDDYAG